VRLAGASAAVGGCGRLRRNFLKSAIDRRGSNQGNTQNEKSLYHRSSINFRCYLGMALFEPRLSASLGTGPFRPDVEAGAAWRELVQNNPDPSPALAAG